MSGKEAARPGILKALSDGRITAQQAAEALRVSLRHVRRLAARYRAAGAAGLVHRGRGQPSPRRLADATRTEIAELIATKYRGFNDVHLAEKLSEVEKIVVSRPTLQRLRRRLGYAAVRRRRPPKHRRRRPRHAAAGSLVQLDGSPFAWLENRGPRLTLLGAIDDATNQILALHFRPAEDLHGYATLLQQLFTAHGLPVALYGDRLNVFVRNDRHWTLEEELQGAQHPTHLGRMLHDLGVGYIAAESPQAKGRIERLWQTLQDRLVSELRLHGIATPEAANAFLPTFMADFNPRFAIDPAETPSAWRPAPRDLASVLSCRYTRLVARDHTVALGIRWLQLPAAPAGQAYVGRRIELRELLDGRLLAVVDGKGRRLAAKSRPELRTHTPPRSQRRASPWPCTPASPATVAAGPHRQRCCHTRRAGTLTTAPAGA